MRNPTFDTDDDFRFNACVGNNGWVDHSTYSDGFDEAVAVLCNTVFNGGTADTLIYPIVFCARHRIELFIKSQLKEIGNIKSGISIPEEKIIKTHDLKILWQLLEAMTRQCDSRYNEHIDKCTSIVMDFFSMDPTGETFRYPYSHEGTKHLTDQSIIGLRRFTEAYSELTENLENIETLSGLLSSEYATGTYTKSLSRTNLEEIAKILPPRNQWGDPSGTFDSIKASTKSRYNIGSLEYSEALKLIQKHREFSSYLGIDNTIQHCPTEKLDTIFATRTKINLLSDSAQNLFKPENLELRDQYIELIENSLSQEELATLLALHELGTSQAYYSESYDFLYKRNLEDIQYSKRESTSYISSKGLIEERVIIALTKMNQHHLLEELEKTKK